MAITENDYENLQKQQKGLLDIDTQGFYFDKQFSVEDVDFVKTAVLSADGKPDEEKRQLADKVADVLKKQYRREK